MLLIYPACVAQTTPALNTGMKARQITLKPKKKTQLKKKKANFIKFWAAYRRSQESGSKLILEACHRQYKLLCEGIRDVRIGDTACYAWTKAGGEW